MKDLELSYSKTTKKGELVEKLAGQFAKAAGYQLIEANINQWRIVAHTLIDGILELVEEKKGET